MSDERARLAARKLTPLQMHVLLNCCYIKGDIRRFGWREFTKFAIDGRDVSSTLHSCIGKRWVKSNTWKVPYYQRTFHLTDLGMQTLIENGWTT